MNQLKYCLIEGSLNDASRPAQTILHNRGIQNAESYMSLGPNALNSHMLLPNIIPAVQCLASHLKDEIHVIVDPDVDGYTSAAMLISYLRKVQPGVRVTWHLHTQKQHGITQDISIPSTAGLLIVPDAGSNDIEACKSISQNGTDIIVLDHHEIEAPNPYAIVVSSQSPQYPNHQLSGAGVTWQFLRALDEEFWSEYSPYYADLAALGNIADVMDMRSPETKYIADSGLAFIQNQLLRVFCEKNSFSIQGAIPTVHEIQFYVVPAMNAVIRAGTQSEKALLFRALLEEEETFSYQKRGSPHPEPETLFQRVVRLSSNIRNRQNKARDAGLISIREFVSRHAAEDKVLFVNVSDSLSEAYTGLAAMRAAEEYCRPCLLLHRKNGDAEIYSGSARNVSNGPVSNLKEFLSQTGLFEKLLGHSNAFGVEILKSNIPKAISTCNRLLAGFDTSRIYRCDFVFPYKAFSTSFIMDVHALRRLWGQGVEEPYIAIEGIPVVTSCVSILGKQSNTWKFEDEASGVSFLKFSCTDDPVFQHMNDPFSDEKLFVRNAVGHVSLNQYKGAVTPQFIISEYEVV